MADIIYAQPQQQGSQLTSLGLLAALAAGLYIVYKSGILQNLLGGGSNGTPSQGSNQGATLGPLTGNGGQLSTGQQQAYAASAAQGAPVLDQLAAKLQQASGAAVQRVTVDQTPAVIVEAGPSTPASFYPGGNGVISSSRQLTAAESQRVVNNLVNSQASQGITNAWWQPQTLTQLSSGVAGINSAGSPQSNIPAGRNHCLCTPALKASGVCGPNDDWYYC